MAMTAEQRHLMELVVERIGQMQRAVTAALPGNAVLHGEFHVGAPVPSTPAEAVKLGRAIAPAAREYRALLLNRDLDAAALARFTRALDELDALTLPEPVVAKPQVAKKKSTRKKAS